MGNSYTRQETYTDGDVITAAHTNNEFDQIKDAFAASTGHTHDGTEGEGGPIAALAVNAITLGAGTTGQDVVVTFLWLLQKSYSLETQQYTLIQVQMDN